MVLEKIIFQFQQLNEDTQGSKVSFPDLFVITPFTKIKKELTKLLKHELKLVLKNIDSTQLNEWIDESVGTVHTFQGKEADIVYFVVGTDEQSDAAADWSCKKPNLLNVAVSRAKLEFFLIGDFKRLKSKENYSEFAKRLEMETC